MTGQPTDDGETALALARSLVAERGYVPEKVGAAYVAWGASEPFDIGNTTRAGLAALAGRGRPNATSQANGALMRAAPIGIAAGNPTRAAAWGRKDAALTHPHPLCQATNAAFCAAIAAGIQGASPQDMIDAARHATTEDGDAIRECLRADGPPRDFLTNEGWVLLAFQNAFFHLGNGTSLPEAVTQTVMQGGDTDTNAAICGALLGAAQGRQTLPNLWISQILGCRTPKVPHVLHPRSSDYWPDAALDLAETLLSL